MCETCGCSDDSQALLTNLATGATLPLRTDRILALDDEGDQRPSAAFGANQADGAIAHAHHHGRMIRFEQALLAKNRELAARNRSWLAERSILALNLISSPGAGKTTLLERTITDVGRELPISVIEGDQATLNDATRIRATGCNVVQINTGAGCHLEAEMTARGFQQLSPPRHSVVMIENVGNLVCPALFDLGERAKVVIMSVTDGEDKPAKYPHAFKGSELMILNKVDLLPYLQFDLERCLRFAREVNPRLRIIQVSATSGEGLPEWYAWLREQRSLNTTSDFARLVQLA